MEVRPATAKDVPVAAEILEDAIAWAGRRGLESWTSGAFANPDGWGRTKLVEAVESGGLYLILVGAEVVGTMSLLPEDPEFWPDSPPDALYLHRFAVRAGHSGRGVGAAAMAWADAEARRRGRRFLRLDCLAGNAGIRTYYERAGFRHRDDIEVRGIRFALYEREAREGTRTTLESS